MGILYLHCPIIVENNRTVPNSTKMTIFIAILLGAYSSNGIGGTTLQIISGCSLQEDVFSSFDWQCSFARKCICSLYCTWRIDINNLKKQKTSLLLWILEEHLSVLSYVTSILVQKSVLIIWPWDCYQLTGLVSNFFRNFIKISQFLSHFGVFITNKEEGVLHCSQNVTKEKNLPIKPPDVHAEGTIMLCLYYYVFVISYYIFKMFLLAMFGKLAIVFLESSVWFKTAMDLKSL